MEKSYNYKEINNLKDLKKRQAELLLDQERYEETFKEDLKTYIHQYSPGYIAKKYTRKPKEKVVTLFNKVKSWFSRKPKNPPGFKS
ncbi:hypothetical protein [Pedobacter gandavensis]|uniref:Uncharacterized protein n=1 Tax=Pedobacter gandavensis TaxID=2679963 RepID=A0ABR6ERD5_9SPHI|nr:hypothetical protein [Pedobacter gandavensis]MBB2147797.1 hypothetical protein [Pedobacter gandavensis]